MANLFLKSPKVMRPIGGGIFAQDCRAGDIGNIFRINNGFNAGFTEVLVYVQHPNTGRRTAILALPGSVELTQEEWETEKPNYPN